MPQGNKPGSGRSRRDVGFPKMTERAIVVLKESAAADVRKARASFENLAGLRHVASSTTDFDNGVVDAESLGGAEALHFESLGILIVKPSDKADALEGTSKDSSSHVLTREPEYIAYPDEVQFREFNYYLRGFRDAADRIYSQFADGPGAAALAAASVAAFGNTAALTWGLQAIGAHTSQFTGQGVKVAILDTGLDLGHPDFVGSINNGNIEMETFSGVPVQDRHGHGTHCAGIACGPSAPASGVRRYGVAPDAHLHIAKVFNDDLEPQAPTGKVVAAIEWAIQKGCQVASLSLGVSIDQKLAQYELPISRALQSGLLVVAAAGNNALRVIGDVGFVEPPANADASLAVAAVDDLLGIADRSARSSAVTGVGGKVNIAAPGVDIFSSYPGGHILADGTSMATPHVAGVAALWIEATGETGQTLWNRLAQTAQAMMLPSADVGSGLVRAP